MKFRTARHRPNLRARSALVVALVASVMTVLTATPPVAAVATNQGGFNPVSPLRLLDTRTGIGCGS